VRAEFIGGMIMMMTMMSCEHRLGGRTFNCHVDKFDSCKTRVWCCVYLPGGATSKTCGKTASLCSGHHYFSAGKHLAEDDRTERNNARLAVCSVGTATLWQPHTLVLTSRARRHLRMSDIRRGISKWAFMVAGRRYHVGNVL
jgi:hypothetical protein